MYTSSIIYLNFTRYIRSDKYHNQSLHYFNSFAVRQNSFGSFATFPPASSYQSMSATFCDPSNYYDAALKTKFHSSCYPCSFKEYGIFNTGFSDVINWHIQHPYYKEISKKSEFISSFVDITNFTPYSFLLL